MMGTRSSAPKIKEYLYPVVNFGQHILKTREIMADFQRRDVINRMWHKDYKVWKPVPTEIADRLGWLQSIDLMIDQIPVLESLAKEIKDFGFRHLVLLGMGGSSLGPEVLREVYGSAPGFPELIVLDSTAPASVEAVTKNIDIRHTLFLVSSKSGGTRETLSFYQYFRALVEQEKGEHKAGENFIAITDAGTPLAHLAERSGFRRSFFNPFDIGGRYSVLSYFGMVPAALIGLDLDSFLERATKMQEACAACIDIGQNPGVWLGAMIGNLALNGRDKLTFIASPSVSSFGLWVEQLLAESTGKEGKGIIPIIGEPLADPQKYGNDRLFVYVRMRGDDNDLLDKAVLKLETAGQPIIQLEMNEPDDIAAEFFRWEFATAVAGAVMKINPFDQPNVQEAKNETKKSLEDLQELKDTAGVELCDDLKKWLKGAKSGQYLALMAYFKPSPAIERAFSGFRQRVLEKYQIATTLGYGPRFLHSTGQLHKGGPNTGLFLQLTAGRRKDLPIPGESYSFGMLTEAEAVGDCRALQAKGRNVARVQLPSASGAAIEKLTGLI